MLLRKSGSVWNRTQDLWICSQKLRPLHHIGGPAGFLGMLNGCEVLATVRAYIVVFWAVKDRLAGGM
jgi:hypothetical protein